MAELSQAIIFYPYTLLSVERIIKFPLWGAGEGTEEREPKKAEQDAGDAI